MVDDLHFSSPSNVHQENAGTIKMNGHSFLVEETIRSLDAIILRPVMVRPVAFGFPQRRGAFVACD